MKKLATILLVGLLAALNASAELKVAIIDMERVFDGYKKVESIEGQLKKEIERTANQLDSKRNEGIAMVKKMEELQAKQNNPALSEEARLAAKQQARQIEDTLEKKRADFEKLSTEARKSLANKEKAQRESIYNEIQRAAVAIANKNGATIILDKSAKGTAGFPMIVYNQGGIEITDNVLALLNAGK